jgi:hypothetical protein
MLRSSSAKFNATELSCRLVIRNPPLLSHQLSPALYGNTIDDWVLGHTGGGLVAFHQIHIFRLEEFRPHTKFII